MIFRIKLCSQCLLQSQGWNSMLHSTLSRVVTPCLLPRSAATRTFSQKSNDDLKYYRSQPVVGNLNSNPYQHRMALKGRWPRNDNSRRLNVAVIGIPNSGKSTLINKALNIMLKSVLLNRYRYFFSWADSTRKG